MEGKRWESRLKICCHYVPTKNANCTETYCFWSSHMFTLLQASFYLPFMAWQWCTKEWQKMETFWVCSGCLCMQKMAKQNCNIWQSTYLWASRRSGTFSRTNQKPSPVCDKHGLSKEERKIKLLSFEAAVATTYLCSSRWLFCWLLDALQCSAADCVYSVVCNGCLICWLGPTSYFCVCHASLFRLIG